MRVLERESPLVLEGEGRDTEDLAELLPDGLPALFTTADIATRAEIPRPLAQRMAFCLRALGVVAPVKRTKSGIHYERS